MTSHAVGKTGPQVILATSFLKQFFLHPFEVGSMLPSSKWLANEMLDGLPTKSFKSVVEYGPGNGSFTNILNAQLTDDAQLVAVEPNEYFAEQIKKQFPNAIVAMDYAERVSQYLGDNRGNVDLVVSGLPFSLMDWDTVERTIYETAQILKPGGHFRTFFYCHMNYYWKIKELKALLNKSFSETSYDCVLRNFPPAFVIKCKK